MELHKLCLLFILLAVPASALSVTPQSIDEVLSAQKVVTVTIHNDLNRTITVDVISGSEYVVPSTSKVTIAANGTATIHLTLKPANVETTVLYVNDSSTFKQNVRIRNANDYFVVVSPIDVTLYTAGNETKFETEIFNPTDEEVTIDITTSLDVEDDHFVLDPKERRAITITAPLGTHEITYSYSFGFRNGTIKQTVTVKKDTSIQQLESKISELESQLYLPSSVTLDVPSQLRVGVETQIKVTSGGKPLENVPVAVGDVIKFTDSTGTVIVKPTKAGKLTVAVLDRFGRVKVQKVVDVVKGTYNFTVSSARVGKKLTIEFPEPGVVKIYRDLELVKTVNLNGTTFTYYPDEPGFYKITYESQSYTGSTTFVVKSEVTVSVYVDGKQITDNVVKPGSTVTVKFSYENGKPIKSGYAYVSLPLTMFGYSKRDSMLFALMGGENFEPPYNYKTKMRLTDGQITISIPEDAGSGIIKVEFAGDDTVEPAAIAIRVTEPEPFYVEHQTEIAAAAITCAAALGLVVSERARDKFLSGLRYVKNRVTGGGDELGI